MIWMFIAMGEVEMGVRSPVTAKGTMVVGSYNLKVGLVKLLSTEPLLQDRTPEASTGMVTRAERGTVMLTGIVKVNE